jgi:hypothetical protein
MTKRIKFSANWHVNVLQIKYKLFQWLRKEQGSFTLESSVVLPLLLGLILLFVLFGMYMYQKVIVYYAASVTAERTAYSWDNSFRQARTGMLADDRHDGLYWRMSEDKMLASLFEMKEEVPSAAVTLPLEPSGATEDDPLSERKMKQAALWLGKAGLAYEGQMSYERGALKKSIEVKLKTPLSTESAEKSWLRREPKSVSSAIVVEPVEFIRSVDLVRYYYAKFANASSGSTEAKSQAGKALAPYKGKDKGAESKG